MLVHQPPDHHTTADSSICLDMQTCLSICSLLVDSVRGGEPNASLYSYILKRWLRLVLRDTPAEGAAMKIRHSLTCRLGIFDLEQLIAEENL